MEKISDILTIIGFILFIILKIFEDITSRASLLCGAFSFWKDVFLWIKGMIQSFL